MSVTIHKNPAGRNCDDLGMSAIEGGSIPKEKLARKAATCYGDVPKEVPQGYKTIIPDTWNNYKCRTHLFRVDDCGNNIPMCKIADRLLKEEFPVELDYVSNAGICKGCLARVLVGGISPFVQCYKCAKKMFKPLNLQVNNKGRHFCSQKCTDSSIELKCASCNITIKSSPSRRRKYCSSVCYRIETTRLKEQGIRRDQIKVVQEAAALYNSCKNKEGVIIYRGREDTEVSTDMYLSYSDVRLSEGMVEKSCKTCSRVFFVYPSYGNRSEKSGLFCSPKCKDTRVKKSCIACGMDFEANKKYHSNQKYCSTKCYHSNRLLNIEAKEYQHIRHVRIRRMRIKSSTARHSPLYFNWLCEKLENVCQYCQKPKDRSELSVDHIIPLSKGGSDDNSNIQPLCLPCNIRKGNRIIEATPVIKELYNNYTTALECV